MEEQLLNTPFYFYNITPQIRTIFSVPYVNIGEDIEESKISYTYRFIMVSEGVCTVRLNKQEYNCKRGDMIFLRPHQNYTTVFRAPNFFCYNLVFDFIGDLSRPFDSQEPLSRILFHDEEKPENIYYRENIKFSDVTVFNSSFVLCDMPETESRIKKMYDMYYSSNRISRMRLNAALLEFIASTAEYMISLNQRAQNNIVYKVIDYIDQHYEDNLSCRSVADTFSYHESYINRVVRAHTGYSLHSYINLVKIRNATRMLLESELSITDIAYRLSFCDSSHFSKVYQEYTGVKPSEVRRTYRPVDDIK